MTVTLARVARSEWIKFASLRSTWISLVAAAVVEIGLAAVLGYRNGSGFAELTPEDATVSSVLEGYFLAQLMVGVLGVLFVSGEYGTGMIRSTLVAVPARVPVVIAKAGVFAVAAIVSMSVAAFAAFAAGQAVLGAYGHSSALTADGLRAVLGTGVYLAVIGLIGGALGWIVRSTAGGIAVLFGILLIVPTMIQTLPWTWLSDIGRYLPSEAGGSFISTFPAPGTLTPWTGLAVLLAWPVILFGAAAVLVRRRDV